MKSLKRVKQQEIKYNKGERQNGQSKLAAAHKHIGNHDFASSGLPCDLYTTSGTVQLLDKPNTAQALTVRNRSLAPQLWYRQATIFTSVICSGTCVWHPGVRIDSFWALVMCSRPVKASTTKRKPWNGSGVTPDWPRFGLCTLHAWCNVWLGVCNCTTDLELLPQWVQSHRRSVCCMC